MRVPASDNIAIQQHYVCPCILPASCSLLCKCWPRAVKSVPVVHERHCRKYASSSLLCKCWPRTVNSVPVGMNDTAGSLKEWQTLAQGEGASLEYGCMKLNIEMAQD